MNTIVIKNDISKAAEIISDGGIVAVPTETVYGLACNGLNEKAVMDIYDVKGRPSIKPLALMVSDKQNIDRFCSDVPSQAYYLAEKYWPGPLTIILNKKAFIPEIVVAGGSTVGLRCPDSPLTLELIKLSGVPLAAPSANPSGKESAVSASEVLAYFDNKIPAVIDGGICSLKVASTIIDLSHTPFKVLREGVISENEISSALLENMTLFGITGTTGSGKTTALDELKKLGAYVIDCDKLYHEMLINDTDLIEQISKEFPDSYFDGEINRRLLGNIVFNDKLKLQRLNDITHKAIVAEINTMLKQAAMDGYLIAAVDAVELFSSGLDSLCDYTVAITAPEDVRLERIVKRDGIDIVKAKQRIRAQKPGSYFEEKASFCIYNDCNKNEFAARCRKIFLEAINQ